MRARPRACPGEFGQELSTLASAKRAVSGWLLPAWFGSWGPGFSRSRWSIDGQLSSQKKRVGTSWQLLISGRECEVHMKPQNGRSM